MAAAVEFMAEQQRLQAALNAANAKYNPGG